MCFLCGSGPKQTTLRGTAPGNDRADVVRTVCSLRCAEASDRQFGKVREWVVTHENKGNGKK